MKPIAVVMAGVAGAFAWSQANAAWSCAAQESLGAPPIKVNNESALIVWDEKNKTEHFIRRASFDSSGKSMGFLVPTPTTPQLSAASDAIFTSLDHAMQPQIIEKKKTGLRFDWLVIPDKQENKPQRPYMPSPQSPVLKLPASGISQKRQRVGGYDATVLAARDSASLEKWLKQNNFKTDASLRAWLRPYVARGWKLTAFKIRSGVHSAELEPVRLSFKTDKPYYPYREPASARAKGAFKAGRTLKVYYLAQQSVAGGIGQSAKWPGKMEFAAALPSTTRDDLVVGAGLKEAQIPKQARLTIFSDASTPRPGTDELFFRPAPDQNPQKPAPIIKEVDARKKIPLEFFVLGIIGASVAAMKLTNRKFDHKRRNIEQ
ncbi:MAG TPA: DUF2330 domain-containing protein [Abditibacteriaceae bacterium]|jgi:hypothetical protein